MIYTPQLRAAVHTIPVPSDFVMDVVEYDGHPPFLLLRFYSSQWAHFSEQERYRCGVYLDTIKRIINAHGINCSLDPVFDEPNTQRLN